MVSDRCTRRRLLHLGGTGLVVSVAGCNQVGDADSNGEGDNDATESASETPAVPEPLRRELPDPNQYISGTRDSYDRDTGVVRIDTDEGSLVLEGPGTRRVTGIAGYLQADELAPSDSWGGEVRPDTYRIGTNATFRSDELTFAPGSFEGVALRADAGIDLIVDGETIVEAASTVRYHTEEGTFSLQNEETPSQPQTTIPAVLRQPLPDPNQYVSGTRDSYERAVGTVEISPSDGTFVLDGPGTNRVTTLSGYLAADALEPTDTWGQEVDNETKLLGTNATFGSDELAFAPGSFEGVSLRADAGVELVIDGDSIVDSANIVRYNPTEGVFERS